VQSFQDYLKPAENLLTANLVIHSIKLWCPNLPALLLSLTMYFLLICIFFHCAHVYSIFDLLFHNRSSCPTVRRCLVHNRSIMSCMSWTSIVQPLMFSIRLIGVATKNFLGVRSMLQMSRRLYVLIIFCLIFWHFFRLNIPLLNVIPFLFQC
jgi:hypothetical protein